LFFPSFCDADYVGCSNTQRSLSGYCVYLGNALVSRPHACKIVWLLNLLNDLNVSYTKLALLSCDNQVAIHIASNPDFHLVHDKVQENIIKTLHVV